jgi:hypothetical protein
MTDDQRREIVAEMRVIRRLYALMAQEPRKKEEDSGNE